MMEETDSFPESFSDTNSSDSTGSMYYEHDAIHESDALDSLVREGITGYQCEPYASDADAIDSNSSQNDSGPAPIPDVHEW